MNELTVISKVMEMQEFSNQLLEVLKQPNVEWETVVGYVDCLDESLRQLDDEVFINY